MYIDPEKAHKERELIKEIDRLSALILGENRIENDLEVVGRACCALDNNTKDLHKVWNEIRAEHRQERNTLNRLLGGILAMLFCIAFLLSFKF